MGRHSGLLFFVFADYYAVRHQQKGKGSESSFPATSEPTTKTMVSVSHSQYKIVKHPNLQIPVHRYMSSAKNGAFMLS